MKIGISFLALTVCAGLAGCGTPLPTMTDPLSELGLKSSAVANGDLKRLEKKAVRERQVRSKID